MADIKNFHLVIQSPHREEIVTELNTIDLQGIFEDAGWRESWIYCKSSRVWQVTVNGPTFESDI